MFKFFFKNQVHPSQVLTAAHPNGQSSSNSSLENEAFQVIRFSDLYFDKESKPLGYGTFSTVYRGKWKGHAVAVKRFKTSDEEKTVDETFQNEKQITKFIPHHPNIVSYYGVSTSNNHDHLILEYLSGGNLERYLRKHPRTDIQRAQIRDKIALQTAQGLAYLWTLGIIHRDIKAKNILLDKDKNAKIGDLGMAVTLDADTPFLRSNETVGSPGWLAPEAFPKDIYSSSIYGENYDIWSYATLLWMLAAHHQWVSFPGIHGQDELLELGRLGKPQTICPTTSKECAELLTRCWDINPTKRPSAAEIVTLLQEGLPLVASVKPTVK